MSIFSSNRSYTLSNCGLVLNCWMASKRGVVEVWDVVEYYIKERGSVKNVPQVAGGEGPRP